MTGAPDTRDALPAGTRVGEYEFLEVLGQGGFGITYLGADERSGFEVAIKEYMPARFAERDDDGYVYPITDEHTEDYEWGLREFLKEARTLARFDHPCIVPVRRLFEAHGTAYFVMDYLEGRTLFALQEEERTLGEDRLRELLVPILAGLEQVHAADYLHCDIKPGNIMLRHDGSPVLIDFGAAQVATAAHSRIARVVTEGYSPIEQYSGTRQDYGPWTDIYAFGAVLYRGMTGTVPIRSPCRQERDELVPVDRAAKRRYGRPLREAVTWALMVEAADRPQSIEEWRESLEERTSGHGSTREPEPRPPPPPAQRWRWLLVGLAVAVAVVCAYIAVGKPF